MEEEPLFLKEFSDTEKFMSIGEKLFGEYRWGIYDLLVLPPSFPYGGMENPCLTFVTPTLLAGDRSLADVVAHEITHSGSERLVLHRFTLFRLLGRLISSVFRMIPPRFAHFSRPVWDSREEKES